VAALLAFWPGGIGARSNSFHWPELQHQRKLAGPSLEARPNPEHGIVFRSVAGGGGVGQCSATGAGRGTRNLAAIDSEADARPQQGGR